jgi:tetratricopeptide (TPR) repeat protein
MGRSLAPVSQASVMEDYGKAANNPFDWKGFEFSAESGPEGMVHEAVRRDAAGHVLTEIRMPAAFVVGSGTRGRSYLLNRDGYLFQSPLSWFSQKNAWDLSPTFETFYPPERVVEGSCLFCHSNQVEAVEHTRNRYEAPIFRGHAIGCERCHGPGELHEKDPGKIDGIDHSIVNPRHLDTARREAVCQQCHLQGVVRFERRGRKTFDYRPGLPLDAFWAVFVLPPGSPELQRAVGQVEQMYSSRCFKASNGAMGCVSCHDPHALPAPAQKAEYYRERCLKCHQANDCSEKPEVRQRKADYCAACHMTTFKSSNIAHTAVTDHRILRQSDNAEPAPHPPSPSPLPPRGRGEGEGGPRTDEVPLVSFFPRESDPHDPNAIRDLGVGLIYLAKQPGPLRERLAPKALPLLEKALQAKPVDPVGWEAKAWALAVQDRRQEGLAAFESALEQAPERELTLDLAARVAAADGDAERSIVYLRRAVAVNPWVWEYHFNLSKLLTGRREWPAALEECRAALRLSPSSIETRMLLITCCLHAGREEEARAEFQTLLALRPKDGDRLRAWFARQAP